MREARLRALTHYYVVPVPYQNYNVEMREARLRALTPTEKFS